MANYILSFPRGGTSLTRLFTSYLTLFQPAQSYGFVGQHIKQHITDAKLSDEKILNFELPTTNPNGKPVSIENSVNNRLILVQRTPIENIFSYLYSFSTPKEDEVSEEQKEKFARNYIRTEHKDLKLVIAQYKTNIAFYNAFVGTKAIMEYERMLHDVEYVIEIISSLYPLDVKRIQLLRDNYEELKATLMQDKLQHPIRCNTRGLTMTYWRSKITDEDFAKFLKLMEDIEPLPFGQSMNRISGDRLIL